MIASVLEDGTTVYNEYVGRYSPYGEWVLGKDFQEGLYNESFTYQQYCVWLDRNLIVVESRERVDAFAHMNVDERIQFLESRGFQAFPHSLAQTLTPYQQIGLVKDFATGRVDLIEQMQKQQKYRPLTPDERERFIAKQKCVAETPEHQKLDKPCNYQFYIDWDLVPEDL